MSEPRKPPWVERLLGELLGMRRDEYVIGCLSFAYFFLVLGSYYVLRPIREQLGVGSGPNTIPFLFLATFLVMLVITPVFGWITSRYPRRSFLPWVYGFFIANMLIFWAVFSLLIGDDRDPVWLGRVFFVWLSIFNLFVVSVFWSFMADIYSREQGRRLFGFIASGGSIGALVSGLVTRSLVLDIGFHNLLPIAALILSLAIVCIAVLRKRIDSSRTTGEDAPGEKPLGGNAFAGISQVLKSPYFGGIAVSSIIASLLGTALYMFTAQLVEQAIPTADARTQYFADVNNATNALAILGQMFLVKQVVSRSGIGVSLVLMPLATVIGFALLAFEPTLAVVTVFTVLRRALGFGFSKPTTDMLYSVVTPEQKYKSKNFIDTAVYRWGDVVGIWSIRGLFATGLAIPGISVIMLPFAALWGAISLWLGRDYRRRARALKQETSNA